MSFDIVCFIHTSSSPDARTFASTTPACYVDSIVNLPQFAPQRGGIESANAKLRQQLEDLVYLWVSLCSTSGQSDLIPQTLLKLVNLY